MAKGHPRQLLVCPLCHSAADSHGRCPNCSHRLGRPTKSRIALLVAVALCGNLTFGIVNLHRNHPDRYRALVTRFIYDGVYQISVPPPAVRPRSDIQPHLSIEEIEHLRGLFMEKRFVELNKSLEDLQSAFERNSATEYRLLGAFERFQNSRDDYRPLLDAWVAATPKSFAPYLARAEYFYRKGWDSRGGAYASETYEEQFSEMRSCFSDANRDVDAALARNPRLFPAYMMRIGIDTAEGKDDAADREIDKSLALFPDSFSLYDTILWSSLPRWGGSYPRMEHFAKLACRQAKTRPEMYFLFQKIYIDEAFFLCKKKDYRKAISLYNAALAYGENGNVYMERARAYLDLDDFPRALNDIDHCLALRPCDPHAYRLRATIHVDMREPEPAKADFAMVERLFPHNPDFESWREWAAKRYVQYGHQFFKTDLQQSVVCYSVALDFDPKCADAWYWRGVAYSRLNRFNLALADCRRAIEEDPQRFDAYRMIDSLLARDRRWDEIVDYWNRYLALEPDNADAYLERAGTYHYKGDKAMALADLKRSCDLGNKKACELYRKNR